MNGGQDEQATLPPRLSSHLSSFSDRVTTRDERATLFGGASQSSAGLVLLETARCTRTRGGSTCESWGIGSFQAREQGSHATGAESNIDIKHETMYAREQSEWMGVPRAQDADVQEHIVATEQGIRGVHAVTIEEARRSGRTRCTLTEIRLTSEMGTTSDMSPTVVSSRQATPFGDVLASTRKGRGGTDVPRVVDKAWTYEGSSISDTGRENHGNTEIPGRGTDGASSGRDEPGSHAQGFRRTGRAHKDLVATGIAQGRVFDGELGRDEKRMAGGEGSSAAISACNREQKEVGEFLAAARRVCKFGDNWLHQLAAQAPRVFRRVATIVLEDRRTGGPHTTNHSLSLQAEGFISAPRGAPRGQTEATHASDIRQDTLRRHGATAEGLDACEQQERQAEEAQEFRQVVSRATDLTTLTYGISSTDYAYPGRSLPSARSGLRVREHAMKAFELGVVDDLALLGTQRSGDGRDGGWECADLASVRQGILFAMDERECDESSREDHKPLQAESVERRLRRETIAQAPEPRSAQPTGVSLVARVEDLARVFSHSPHLLNTSSLPAYCSVWRGAEGATVEDHLTARSDSEGAACETHEPARAKRTVLPLAETNTQGTDWRRMVSARRLSGLPACGASSRGARRLASGYDNRPARTDSEGTTGKPYELGFQDPSDLARRELEERYPVGQSARTFARRCIDEPGRLELERTEGRAILSTSELLEYLYKHEDPAGPEDDKDTTRGQSAGSAMASGTLQGRLRRAEARAEGLAAEASRNYGRQHESYESSSATGTTSINLWDRVFTRSSGCSEYVRTGTHRGEGTVRAVEVGSIEFNANYDRRTIGTTADARESRHTCSQATGSGLIASGQTRRKDGLESTESPAVTGKEYRDASGQWIACQDGQQEIREDCAEGTRTYRCMSIIKAAWRWAKQSATTSETHGAEGTAGETRYRERADTEWTVLGERGIQRGGNRTEQSIEGGRDETESRVVARPASGSVLGAVHRRERREDEQNREASGQWTADQDEQQELREERAEGTRMFRRMATIIEAAWRWARRSAASGGHSAEGTASEPQYRDRAGAEWADSGLDEQGTQHGGNRGRWGTEDGSEKTDSRTMPSTRLEVDPCRRERGETEGYVESIRQGAGEVDCQDVERQDADQTRTPRWSTRIRDESGRASMTRTANGSMWVDGLQDTRCNTVESEHAEVRDVDEGLSEEAELGRRRSKATTVAVYGPGPAQFTTGRLVSQVVAGVRAGSLFSRSNGIPGLSSLFAGGTIERQALQEATGGSRAIGGGCHTPRPVQLRGNEERRGTTRWRSKWNEGLILEDRRTKAARTRVAKEQRIDQAKQGDRRPCTAVGAWVDAEGSVQSPCIRRGEPGHFKTSQGDSEPSSERTGCRTAAYAMGPQVQPEASLRSDEARSAREQPVGTLASEKGRSRSQIMTDACVESELNERPKGDAMARNGSPANESSESDNKRLGLTVPEEVDGCGLSEPGPREASDEEPPEAKGGCKETRGLEPSGEQAKSKQEDHWHVLRDEELVASLGRGRASTSVGRCDGGEQHSPSESTARGRVTGDMEATGKGISLQMRGEDGPTGEAGTDEPLGADGHARAYCETDQDVSLPLSNGESEPAGEDTEPSEMQETARQQVQVRTSIRTAGKNGRTECRKAGARAKDSDGEGLPQEDLVEISQSYGLKANLEDVRARDETKQGGSLEPSKGKPEPEMRGPERPESKQEDPVRQRARGGLARCETEQTVSLKPSKGEVTEERSGENDTRYTLRLEGEPGMSSCAQTKDGQPEREETGEYALDGGREVAILQVNLLEVSQPNGLSADDADVPWCR
ncbi:uncharacterized protein B0H18DRAFT_1158264, partial [Fomitopsis serialis]|uniref:uncharacterized protein n=1 Tax=Fomitopsis serialis TaxID=139415 RepID=UPI002008AD13